MQYLAKEETRNYIKTVFAIRTTKRGLSSFVSQAVTTFQQDTLRNIRRIYNLRPDAVCSSCPLPNLLPCPTKNICNPKRCRFHKSSVLVKCPTGVCNDFCKAILGNHFHSGPSWKNTHSEEWCSNAWEVAKCYCPPDGYNDKLTIDETDFNGVLSVMLNATCIRSRLNNISAFEQAREIGKVIRHSANNEISSAVLTQYIDTLKSLLSDIATLTTQQITKDATAELDKIEKDTWEPSIEDVENSIEQEIKDSSCELLLKGDYRKSDLEFKINSLNSALCAVRYARSVAPGIKGTTIILSNTPEQVRRDIYSGKELSDLKASLVQLYEEKHGHLSLAPLSDSDTKLSKLYVAPQLKKTYYECETAHGTKRYNTIYELEDAEEDEVDIRGVVKTQINITSLKELFNHSDVHSRNVFVFGENGCGKTAFCQFLTLVWCELNGAKVNLADHFSNKESSNQTEYQISDLDALKRFDFVFMLSLKNATEPGLSIKQMIKEQILSAFPQSYDDQLLEKILSEERCLFIVDGMDECESKCFITNYPVRQNCILLRTSRPWKIADISAKDIEKGICVVLGGLCEKSSKILSARVYSCLRKRFGGPVENDKVSFNSKLSNLQAEEGLLSPMVVTHLSCICFKTDDVKETETNMYIHVVDMLFERALLRKETKYPFDQHLNESKLSFPSCFQNVRVLKLCIRALCGLGKLVFDSQIKGIESSFSQETLNSALHSDDIDLALDAGILSKQRSCKLYSSPTMRFFFCIHRNYQELLLAIFVWFISETKTSQIYEQTLEELKQYLNSFERVHSMEVFLDFICDLNAQMAMHIIDHCASVRVNENKMAQMQLILNPFVQKCIENGHVWAHPAPRPSKFVITGRSKSLCKNPNCVAMSDVQLVEVTQSEFLNMFDIPYIKSEKSRTFSLRISVENGIQKMYHELRPRTNLNKDNSYDMRKRDVNLKDINRLIEKSLKRCRDLTNKSVHLIIRLEFDDCETVISHESHECMTTFSECVDVKSVEATFDINRQDKAISIASCLAMVQLHLEKVHRKHLPFYNQYRRCNVNIFGGGQYPSVSMSAYKDLSDLSLIDLDVDGNVTLSGCPKLSRVAMKNVKLKGLFDVSQSVGIKVLELLGVTFNGDLSLLNLERLHHLTLIDVKVDTESLQLSGTNQGPIVLRLPKALSLLHINIEQVVLGEILSFCNTFSSSLNHFVLKNVKNMKCLQRKGYDTKSASELDEISTESPNYELSNVLIDGNLSGCFVLSELTFCQVQMGELNLENCASLRILELISVGIRGCIKFQGCSELKQLRVETLNTDCEVDLSCMKKLKLVKLYFVNTGKQLSLSFLPKSVKSIKLNSVNVEQLNEVIKTCSKLKELDLMHLEVDYLDMSTFKDLQFVTVCDIDIKQDVLFQRCDALSNLEINRVKVSGSMNIARCSKLREFFALDIQVREHVSLTDCLSLKAVKLTDAELSGTLEVFRNTKLTFLCLESSKMLGLFLRKRESELSLCLSIVKVERNITLLCRALAKIVMNEVEVGGDILIPAKHLDLYSVWKDGNDDVHFDSKQTVGVGNMPIVEIVSVNVKGIIKSVSDDLPENI